MNEIIKKYTNGAITIVWKPAQCIHSTVCWKKATGLPHVFNPGIRPWIQPEHATTEELVNQITLCPSGALSYYYNDAPIAAPTNTNATIIEVTENGPLLVRGNVDIKGTDGGLTRKENNTALCRCGASANKPFCDGSHHKVGFKG
ncbi:MAG: hypothetical protein EBZ77_15165 [Chitinophagia bacterium]|nr:hypothetical protein [Chitinophagia bacterium]